MPPVAPETPSEGLSVVLWEFNTDKIYYSSPSISPNGIIYIGSSGGLYAVNRNGSGNKVASQHIWGTPSIADDGSIYYGDESHNITSWNSSGINSWSFRARGQEVGGAGIHCSPAIGNNGLIYVGNAWPDGVVYALDRSGGKKWEFITGNEAQSSPAISIKNKIYIGSLSGNFFALDGETGKKEWSFKFGGYSSPAIGSNGTIYFIGAAYGLTNTRLYAIDPDGSLKWEFPMGGYPGYASPAIGFDGTIYCGSRGGLYAVKPDGSLKWQFGGRFDLSSPA